MKPAKRTTSGDSSRGYIAPPMSNDLKWSTIGSTGLRQYGGWVRDEFLPQLTGPQAARTFREMQDNSPTVGAIMFAIRQSMREVTWRVESADDSADARAGAEFAYSLMEDMSQSWPDFVSEMLSMLGYGFAPCEIVYKRRNGRAPHPLAGRKTHISKFDDGLIGWAKLPLRSQDTVIKWFFDDEGEITGLTQQPWFGGLIDIPIEKILLFRPAAHKNNPEGNSILRQAYRPWWFVKRLEEQEAIALERMSGTPEYRVPAQLLKDAAAGDTNAQASLAAFKNVVCNIRVDEQMGLVTPSDTFQNADGSQSTIPMYEFKYTTPVGSKASADFDTPIARHKLDIIASVLADFLQLGHSARGTQSLASTKVDLFLNATAAWLDAGADTLNCGLARLWAMNGFDAQTQPKFVPDVPQRQDLDTLSNFILRLSQSGMKLFPDPDLEDYIRDAAGLPEMSAEQLANVNRGTDSATADASQVDPIASQDVKKQIAGMLGRRLIHKGYLSVRSGRRRR